MRNGIVLFGFIFVASALAAGEPAGSADDDAGADETSVLGGATAPVIRALIEPQKKALPPPVEWAQLARDSSRFLLMEHAFRFATEPATRRPGEALFPGYMKSITSLHGWSDGDPFYVNYVGHPMQGAVAGYLFVRNDPRYWGVEFGQDRNYWRSRLRAAGFAWAYSEQFEIGPFSEATVGAIQSKFPSYGLADHVVTPTLGLGWMIAEDAIDRYVLGALERRIDHPYLINILRGALTPSRSTANLLGFKAPWARESRSFPRYERPRDSSPEQDSDAAAPFEVAITSKLMGASSGPCIGGGGEAAFRVRPDLQLVVEVAGCKLTGLGKDWSGDSLSYLIGPRWRGSSGSRWTPYAQFLLGGAKLTEEEMLPVKKAAIEAAAGRSGAEAADHNNYTRHYETSGFSIAAGTGVDLKLNEALALRVAKVEYTKSWAQKLNGSNAPNGLQMSAGLVLRLGTW